MMVSVSIQSVVQQFHLFNKNVSYVYIQPEGEWLVCSNVFKALYSNRKEEGISMSKVPIWLKKVYVGFRFLASNGVRKRHP